MLSCGAGARADTTFLDLRELDLYWDKIVEGRCAATLPTCWVTAPTP